MKNLVECKSTLSAGGYGASTGNSERRRSHVVGSLGFLRDKSRSNAPWKHKCDILSESFFEAILQGLTSSFHDNKRRPLPEEIPGDPITAPNQPDQKLLSSAFNNLFSSASYLRNKTDVIASLKLWYSSKAITTVRRWIPTEEHLLLSPKIAETHRSFCWIQKQYAEYWRF